MGLVVLLTGRKSSGSTSTKFEGNRPTILLSRRSLPIHHEPSPALRHSINSPSMKPRSRFDCEGVKALRQYVSICTGCGLQASSTYLSTVRVDSPAPAREARGNGRWRGGHDVVGMPSQQSQAGESKRASGE